MNWKCPECAFENAHSITKCVCGYELPVVQKNIVPLLPSYSLNWIRATWIIAFVFTFILLIGAVVPTGYTEKNVKYAFIAFIIGSLAFGVFKGDERCAWALVINQFFNPIFLSAELFNTHSETSVEMSLFKITFSTILFGVFTAGAIHLRRANRRNLQIKISESQLWARSLYEVAFLQAAWTTVMLSISIFNNDLSDFIGVHIGLLNFLDVGLLIGLGYAAYKKRTWAGYGLVIYQIVNTYFVIKSEVLQAEITVPLTILIIYILGALHLRKL